MGLINIEQLLSPISESEPAGANLEYDPAFAELDRSAEGKPERRIGDVSVPAEPPDWSLVLEKSLALLERTRDLRVSVHLAHALLRRGGYAGFAEGLAFIADLVRVFWENVHPELELEDDNDPTIRTTALLALCSPATILTLRSTPLAQVRALGTVSLRDVQAMAGGDSPSAGTPTADATTVEAVFQEVELEVLDALERAANESISSLLAIDAVFETHTGSRGPDWAPLTQLLREVLHVLKPRLQARRAALAGNDPGAEQDEAGEQAASDTGSGRAPSGEIRSRDDVVRAIDKICAYYARFEPASPLPLLLERCRRLVSCTFLEIIQDLAPDSLAQVNSLGGRKPE